MMRVLFLDDNPNRCSAAFRTFFRDDLYATNTVAGSVRLLETSGSFNLVSLDHDLGGEFYVDSKRQDCGMEVVRWIVANKPVIEVINIHTWNNEAGQKMVDSLSQAGYRVERRLFGDNGFT